MAVKWENRAASEEARCPLPLLKKVIACFVNHVFTFGPIYGFCVFLPVIKADLNIALPEASAISSTMNTAEYAGSLLAGLVMPQKVGHATVGLFGAVGVLTGLALLSMIDTVYAGYPAVILAGLALGSSNLAGLVALNATVPSGRRATFVGLASCGTSVGTILLPQFYTLLTDQLGWRWAMRINAATSCVFLAAAAPFFRVQDSPPKIESTIFTGEAKSATSATPSPQTSEATIPNATVPKRRKLADPRFLCWWLNMFGCFCGYFFAPSLLAEFATEELHLSSTLSATCYSLMGVCGLVSRLALGCLTHLCGGPRRLYFLSQLLVGVIACLMPFCWNAASLLAWSAIFGLSSGPIIALVSVVLSDLFGTKDLALYQGVSRTGVGAGNLLGVPLLSFLAEKQGYRVASALAGSLISFSTICLVILEIFQRRSLKSQSIVEDKC